MQQLLSNVFPMAAGRSGRHVLHIIQRTRRESIISIRIRSPENLKKKSLSECDDQEIQILITHLFVKDNF
jgi:hypothetical protein